MRARVLAVTIVVLLFLPVPTDAMVNSIAPPEADAHLDAVGAFGVARHLGLEPGHPDARDHEWFCAATLVRPSTIALAKHCTTGVTGPFAVRFRRHEDGSIGTIDRGPQSFSHAIVSGIYLPAEGDLALAYLTQPVTHIKPIPMEFPPAEEGPVELAGWGREGPDPGEGPRRELRSCQTALQAVWQSQLIFPTAWSGGPCGPNLNDSGGAVLQRGLLVGVLTGYWSAEPLARHASDPRFSGRTCGLQ